MTIRILIVDDSRFICKRIREVLEEDLELRIVGAASNGKQAVLMAAQIEPDVITMDVEMSVMNGILAVKAILIFSAEAYTGAYATLDAGAVAFLSKKQEGIDYDRKVAERVLRLRVRIVAMQANRIKHKLAINKRKTPETNHNKTEINEGFLKVLSRESLNNLNADIKISLLVIIASTGGPAAIQTILSRLSGQCLFPILIVQHMPHDFTKSFADRLDKLSAVSVKEAENGDVLKAGQALLAPGGMQMEVIEKMGKKTIVISDKKEGDIYGPSADITLFSVAKAFSSGVLTVVLTGMSSDGKKGASRLKHSSFNIWAQNEESCTIYGMPKAIVDANLADEVLSLNEIAYKFEKLK